MIRVAHDASVSQASSLAQHAGLSIVKSSQSTAQVEGAYRLIRNPSVSPQAVAEAGFTATARACEAHPLLLALEYTTTINFSHSTAFDDQGNTTRREKVVVHVWNRCRMQTRDNLERMVVIKAFIAVRGLGLRQGGVSEETQNDSYEKILTPTEWKLLWVKLEGKPLPAQALTLKWA